MIQEITLVFVTFDQLLEICQGRSVLSCFVKSKKNLRLCCSSGLDFNGFYKGKHSQDLAWNDLLNKNNSKVFVLIIYVYLIVDLILPLKLTKFFHFCLAAS